MAPGLNGNPDQKQPSRHHEGGKERGNDLEEKGEAGKGGGGPDHRAGPEADSEA